MQDIRSDWKISLPGVPGWFDVWLHPGRGEVPPFIAIWDASTQRHVGVSLVGCTQSDIDYAVTRLDHKIA